MNNITDFTNATIYSHRGEAFANLVSTEIIPPSFPIFAIHKGGAETIVFDKRKYSHTSYQRLIDALNSGIITEFDKKTLCLIGTVTGGITAKMISELFVLLGYTDENIRASTDKSIRRLWSYGLIDSFHFKAIDLDKACATRILILTPNGFHILKSWGITGFYYNAIDIAGRSVAVHKRNCATAQAVVAWLKHIDSFSFSFGKTIKEYVEKNKEAIVRPSATIVTGNAENPETIHFETVRRTENSFEELLNKLYRYNLVFSYMEKIPTLIIIGEDEYHTKEIFEYLATHNANTEDLVFSHDLALAGNDFRSAFYAFENNNRIQLHIA